MRILDRRTPGLENTLVSGKESSMGGFKVWREKPDELSTVLQPLDSNKQKAVMTIGKHTIRQKKMCVCLEFLAEAKPDGTLKYLKRASVINEAGF